MSDFEGAIKAAIRLEEDGRDFYLAAAGKSTNVHAKKTFESLAADEAKHIEWIKERTAGVLDAATANRELYAALKGIFADASPESAAASADEDIEAIDAAICMEQKSVEAYADWAANGPSDAIRKLGSMLVGIEKFHRQVLENAKEYLANPGDWFMQEEGWSFDGG
jgi:rubrerythrin